MSNQKKGFVLYFDSLGLLSLFPPEQIGELLLALYDYALQICGTEETPEEALSRYPGLDTATQVGFCSMAGHILRDTRKWKQRQSNCQQSALERHRKTQTTPAPVPTPAPAPAPTPAPQQAPAFRQNRRSYGGYKSEEEKRNDYNQQMGYYVRQFIDDTGFIWILT